MRLFKRRSLDQSPELVSATPISQDVATSRNNPESERTKHLANGAVNETKAASIATLTTPRRTKDEMTSKCTQPRQQASSGFSATKSLTTWSRKVGQKWEQLKRTESSEILSVSSRRRRWSPHRKSCGDVLEDAKKNQPTKEASSTTDFAKPKRISRVESLRNLFKSSSERSSSSSKKSSSIKEEDEPVNSQCMEKSLSEGMLKLPGAASSSPDFEELTNKRWQISRSIHNLEQRDRVLDYFLVNQEVLTTNEGMSLAKQTLDETATVRRRKNLTGGTGMLQHRQRRVSADSADELNSSRGSTSSSELAVDNVKRDLFNARSMSEEDKSGSLKSSEPMITGLEDLMSGLKLACDESGYDSDSTRAGADSPDSEKSSTPSMFKPSSFSLADYEGIDLSLPFSTPKKRPLCRQDKREEDLCGDKPQDKSAQRDQLDDENEQTLIVGSDSDSFNDTAKTDQTILEQDDFSEIKLKPSSSGLSSSAESGVSMELCSTQYRTPEKKRPESMRSIASAHQSKFGSLQKSLKVQRKLSNVSVMNLLDNATSPCKDSPPASKVVQALKSSQIRCYTPKRTRSAIESESSTESKNNVKRPVLNATSDIKTSASVLPTAKTPLIRRELKTMKLSVEKAGSLGISVQRCDAVRAYYVIASMDQHGEAVKSKLFRVGDEIVRVSGRRLRGMSLSEAKHALKSCVGTVELQIAREPNFFFGGELGETWASDQQSTMVRSKSDTAVWGPTNLNCSVVDKKFDITSDMAVADQDAESDSATARTILNEGKISEMIAQPTRTTEINCHQGEENLKTCQIIGAVTKDGRTVSIQDMECSDGEEQKVTGMKKFQIRKRSSTMASGARRATSLSMDLLTVTMEKGGPKRLGFTIVGGADSSRGKMGIFIKDILANGQAAEQAVLRPEDEVLAVNGIALEGMTHARALQIFKTAKKGKLVLHVGRRDPSHKRLVNVHH